MSTTGDDLPPASREERLVDAFVALADTLVGEFDPVDFLHRLTDGAVDLVRADEAGLLLADSAGRLRVMASSNEQAHVLDVLQLQARNGPCLDCYEQQSQVVSHDLASDRHRWPSFADAALSAGFRSVVAVPMRLRSHVLGALNLFTMSPSAMSDADVIVAQALADVATIGLLQEQSRRESQVLADQLQGALQSRIVIEQAKGIISENTEVAMKEAFELLRAHARSHSMRLQQVAQSVVDGDLAIQNLEDASR